MKRDFDLIRKILLYVEENREEGSFMINKLENYDNQTLIFHCKLLADKGFLKGRALKSLTPGNDDFQCYGITYEGYEFLDKIRDITIWGKIKKYVKDNKMELGFHIINTAFTIVTNIK
jgi:hypothetical protein